MKTNSIFAPELSPQLPSVRTARRFVSRLLSCLRVDIAQQFSALADLDSLQLSRNPRLAEAAAEGLAEVALSDEYEGTPIRNFRTALMEEAKDCGIHSSPAARILNARLHALVVH
ncbi:MAG TPA: hypothetical protein VG796_24800 [Verrucomicrobiales bacterium]|nr:hypothetical protein [Verrucomicrobiales bacterium]